jgi:hypothetical protein
MLLRGDLQMTHWWRSGLISAGLGACLAVAACEGPNAERCSYLEALVIEDAPSDAREALARGDASFLAIYGERSLVFPGVEDLGGPDYEIIEDSSPHGGCPGLAPKARAYAERYNQTLARALSSPREPHP